MRFVHLYFAKLFGCQILEGGIAIDIAPFSKAILEEKPHPNLFLAFGRTPANPLVPVLAGGTNVHAALLNGKVTFATWFYEVGSLRVNIMYAADGERKRLGKSS